MKKDIHPTWYPNAKVLVEGEEVMTIGATVPEIRVEIWSGTHPFYTGQQRLIDTEGQVDRFMRRLQKRDSMKKQVETAQEKAKPTNLSIEAIGLGTRAEKAFEEAGVTTVGDIVKLLEQGDDALLALPGIGQKALIDIKRFLRAEELIA